MGGDIVATYADVKVPLQPSGSGFGRETGFSPHSCRGHQGEGRGISAWRQHVQPYAIRIRMFSLHHPPTNQHHNTHRFGQHAAELCSPMRAWVGAPWTTYRAGGGTSIATVGQRQTGSTRTHLPTLRRMWEKEGGMTFVYSHHVMLFIASLLCTETSQIPTYLSTHCV